MVVFYHSPDANGGAGIGMSVQIDSNKDASRKI